jgi:PAS domain S-box-containing protein
MAHPPPLPDQCENCAQFQARIAELEHALEAQSRTEAELRTREARFRLLVEHSSDLIARQTLDGVYLYVSPACTDLLGYTPGQLIGRSGLDFCHPDDLATTRQVYTTPQEGSRTTTIIWRCRRADGEYTWLETTSHILLTPQGSTACELYSTSRDITAHQLIEQALRESETRFRQLAEHLPIVFFLHGADGQILYVSPAFDTLWGRPRTEVLTQPMSWIEAIHPDDQPHVMRRLSQLDDGAESFEYRILQPDGSLRWVLSQAIPIVDADGALERVVGFVSDISAWKRLEFDLRESIARFEQMADNIGEVVWMHDLVKDQMVYISPAYERIWGRSSTHLYSRPRSFMEAIHPDDQARIVAAFAKQALGQYDEEYRIVRPDGSIRWIRDRAFPILDPQGHPYRIVGIAADITDRKQAQVEQQQLQEKLIQLQAATLAELSTPLIPITDQVLVLPLIGVIDSSRAQQIMETLLSGVAERSAETVIVDITGVSVVDTQVANTLIQAAQAVRLLGAEVLLTGIRAEIAQTLIGLGISLSTLRTSGTLQSGIAMVLEQRSKR